jgi:uncharacterized protein (TIGR02599 family)
MKPLLALIIGRAKTVTTRRAKRGFTLVEMMAAIAVLMVLLVIIAMATTGARTTITRSQATLGAFATARTAFENLTDKLSQATLNTYLDYYGFTQAASVSGPMVSRGVFMAQHGSETTFTPQLFGRCSDLQFRIMQNQQHSYYGQEIYFQTPAAFSATTAYQSTQGLLNSCSYFVQYCSDAGSSGYRPGAGPGNPTNILPGAANWRYRLMQGLEPSENMSTYSITTAAVNASSSSVASQTTYLPWQTNIQNKGSSSTLATNVVPVADNVIMLSFWPRLPLKNDAAGTGQQLLGGYDGTTKYIYDSQVNILNMFSTYNPGATTPVIPLQKPWDEQLPPIVEVTMVVIDEASAARLASTVTTPGNEPALIASTSLVGGVPAGALIHNGANSYTTTTGANTLATDLQATENALIAAHLNFRIMSSYVLMREAKWSSSSIPTGNTSTGTNL